MLWDALFLRLIKLAKKLLFPKSCFLLGHFCFPSLTNVKWCSCAAPSVHDFSLAVVWSQFCKQNLDSSKPVAPQSHLWGFKAGKLSSVNCLVFFCDVIGFLMLAGPCHHSWWHENEDLSLCPHPLLSLPPSLPQWIHYWAGFCPHSGACFQYRNPCQHHTLQGMTECSSSCPFNSPAGPPRGQGAHTAPPGFQLSVHTQPGLHSA